MSITIQETSKVLKIQLILSTIMLVIGAFLLTFGFTPGTESIVAWGGNIFGGGVLWYIITKMLIWWNHK